MTSLILATVARLVMPVLLLLSLHLMLRGHNAPGGGFIAGLMTAAAIVLQYIAYDSRYVQRTLPLNYRLLLTSGLALAGGTGVAACFYGSAFLEHRFTHVNLPLLGDVELTTAMGFDLGVYLVAVGVTLMIIAALGSTTGEERGG